MIKDTLRVALRGEMPAHGGWAGTAALAAGLAVSIGLEFVEAPVGLALILLGLSTPQRTPPDGWSEDAPHDRSHLDPARPACLEERL
jgi:hypothetical protein